MAERTIERTCEKCGAAFSVIPSRLKHGRGKHCSKACQYAAIAARPRLAVTLQCIGCGQAFEKPPSVLRGAKGAGKYCSRACRDIYWIGEKNPNWQNGDRVYKRGSRWFSIRRRILARDGHQCVECGSADRLHVHHFVPFRMFDDPDIANDDSNLVSLCPRCHRRTDARHKWVKLQSGVLQFNAGGAAWELAREKGLV